MITNLKMSVDEAAMKRLESAPEGRHLPIALSAAVPLRILGFAEITDPQERWKYLQERLARLNGDIYNGMNFCELMEYVLHRGKNDETAHAFNALAEAIAIMAFVPGGVTCFGQHFEYTERQGQGDVP